MKVSIMTLADLTQGQQARVEDFTGDESLIQRLLEMGLTEGVTVEYLRKAPMGDPLEFRLRGYNLSLRKSEAACVLVTLL